MKSAFVVPNDAGVIRGWVEDYAATFGVPPIAGGETPGSVATPPAPPAGGAPPAPAAPAPPAQQAPPPGQPAAPAPQEGQQPQAPPPSEGPAAPPAPASAEDINKIVERLDQLAPPAAVDPLAVELGLVEPPQGQPFPGQPTLPAQPGQAAGQPQTGQLPQHQPNPAALPGQAQQQPGQVPGQPGQVDPTEELVNRMIDERARGVVDSVLQQQLIPYLRGQQASQQRQEILEIREDYPELKDPARASEVVAQAKVWAEETLGDASFATQPGYLETVLLAMRGREAAAQQQAAAAGQQPGSQSNGEVPIEGGGGANPAPAVSESTQLADAIVAAGPGGGLNDLWA